MSKTAIGCAPSALHLNNDDEGDVHEVDAQPTEQQIRIHRRPTQLTWLVTPLKPQGAAPGPPIDAAPSMSSTSDKGTAVAASPGPPSGAAPRAHGRVPCSIQQHVDKEAEDWSMHWACNTDMPPCQWPADLGPLPPQLELVALEYALATFPDGLGLGWDAIHPKALLRLSDQLLMALLRLLFLCEVSGEWPIHTTAVIIALLPKTSPGLRPIGVFPRLPKKWTKIRRQEAIR